MAQNTQHALCSVCKQHNLFGIGLGFWVFVWPPHRGPTRRVSGTRLALLGISGISFFWFSSRRLAPSVTLSVKRRRVVDTHGWHNMFCLPCKAFISSPKQVSFVPVTRDGPWRVNHSRVFLISQPTVVRMVDLRLECLNYVPRYDRCNRLAPPHSTCVYVESIGPNVGTQTRPRSRSWLALVYDYVLSLMTPAAAVVVVVVGRDAPRERSAMHSVSEWEVLHQPSINGG